MNCSGAQPVEPILRWLEDETFYSLCSRQHYFSSRINPSATLAWLFNGNQIPITHDFPCNLSALNSQALALWGKPETIIYKHTIVPIFFPFQAVENIAAVMQAMHSTHIGSLKYRLGLLTGRFGGDHPLKVCPACMEFDRVNYGVAYWHLAHQYPGIILCPVHGLLLRECTLNRQWSERHQWILPNETHLAEVTTPLPTATNLKTLQQLGAAVLDLATYGISKHFDLDTVRRVYKESLDELGTSRSAREKAASSFAEYTCCLQPYPPLTSLPTSTQCAIAFIGQLTRNPRGHSHPLKHLTLITWLFGGLGSFIEAYERLNGARPDASEIKHESDIRLDTVKIGESQVRLKPKKLKPLLRITILECLRNGYPKGQICSRFGISISTVNRLLRSEPIIVKLRTEKHQEDTRYERRTEWLAIVNGHPGVSPKKIRSVIPSTYEWLYRNDRKWLLMQTHKLPSGRDGNYSRVDWMKRDLELSDLVSKTLIRIYGSDYGLNFQKREIFTLVPALSRSLENRTHYPKTRKLLTAILQTLKPGCPRDSNCGQTRTKRR